MNTPELLKSHITKVLNVKTKVKTKVKSKYVYIMKDDNVEESRDFCSAFKTAKYVFERQLVYD